MEIANSNSETAGKFGKRKTLRAKKVGRREKAWPLKRPEEVLVTFQLTRKLQKIRRCPRNFLCTREKKVNTTESTKKGRMPPTRGWEREQSSQKAVKK